VAEAGVKLTRRTICGIIWQVTDNGGTVARVLVSRGRWNELLGDFADAGLVPPEPLTVFGVPVFPADLPPGEFLRTEPEA
jgi:hypothetical protein